MADLSGEVHGWLRSLEPGVAWTLHKLHGSHIACTKCRWVLDHATISCMIFPSSRYADGPWIVPTAMRECRVLVVTSEPRARYAAVSPLAWRAKPRHCIGGDELHVVDQPHASNPSRNERSGLAVDNFNRIKGDWIDHSRVVQRNRGFLRDDICH